MRRPQFSIRTLLWLTLVVAAFLGGILFERERKRREEAFWDDALQQAIKEALAKSRLQHFIHRPASPATHP